MFNCGMLAIELPKEDIEQILALESAGDIQVNVDLPGQKINASVGSKSLDLDFEISPFDKALVEAGGWVEFADARY